MFSLFSIPSIVSSLLNFSTPFINSILKFGGWYLTELWYGLKGILGNSSNWIALLTIIAISTIYGTQLANCSLNKDLTPVEKIDKWRYDFGTK